MWGLARLASWPTVAQPMARPCVAAAARSVGWPPAAVRGLATASAKASAAARAPGRADRGLFAGRLVQHGNNVSHSQRKTRRAWKPNVQRKRLYSEALGELVRLNVTTHALRCIDRYGGLDRYLLRVRARRGAAAVLCPLPLPPPPFPSITLCVLRSRTAPDLPRP